MVRAIRREFDPNFIPMWVKKVHKTKSGVHIVTGNFALSGFDPDRRSVIAPWVHQCLMPTMQSSRRYPRPTRIHLHLFHRDDKTGLAIPNTFVPFDWLVYKGLISMRDDMRAQERREYLNTHGRHVDAAKARQSAEDQAMYESVADEKYVGRHVDAFDADDWRGLEAGVVGSNSANPVSVSVRRSDE